VLLNNQEQQPKSVELTMEENVVLQKAEIEVKKSSQQSESAFTSEIQLYYELIKESLEKFGMDWRRS
jgi:hypothetical protein